MAIAIAIVRVLTKAIRKPALQITRIFTLTITITKLKNIHTTKTKTRYQPVLLETNLNSNANYRHYLQISLPIMHKKKQLKENRVKFLK